MTTSPPTPSPRPSASRSARTSARIAMLLERIPPQDLNPARRRMARIPQGAELIENAISKAPGFMIGNVIVMAGVPVIMQAMLDAARRAHRQGRARCWWRRSTRMAFPEGRYAADLERDRQGA